VAHRIDWVIDEKKRINLPSLSTSSFNVASRVQFSPRNTTTTSPAIFSMIQVFAKKKKSTKLNFNFLSKVINPKNRMLITNIGFCDLRCFLFNREKFLKKKMMTPRLH
jgi:hypothetical protein